MRPSSDGSIYRVLHAHKLCMLIFGLEAKEGVPLTTRAFFLKRRPLRGAACLYHFCCVAVVCLCVCVFFVFALSCLFLFSDIFYFCLSCLTAAAMIILCQAKTRKNKERTLVFVCAHFLSGGAIQLSCPCATYFGQCAARCCALYMQRRLIIVVDLVYKVVSGVRQTKSVTDS